MFIFLKKSFSKRKHFLVGERWAGENTSRERKILSKNHYPQSSTVSNVSLMRGNSQNAFGFNASRENLAQLYRKRILCGKLWSETFHEASNSRKSEKRSTAYLDLMLLFALNLLIDSHGIKGKRDNKTPSIYQVKQHKYFRLPRRNLFPQHSFGESCFPNPIKPSISSEEELL